MKNLHTKLFTIGPCGAMVASLVPDQKLTSSNSAEDQSFSSFNLLVTLKISINNAYTLYLPPGRSGSPSDSRSEVYAVEFRRC